MMNLVAVILCLTLTSFIFIENSMAQNSVSFSLKGQQKPARDLIDDQGNMISFDVLLKKTQANQDLSGLNPAPNRFWQDKTYSAVGSVSELPPDGATVEFIKSEGRYVDSGTEVGKVRNIKTRIEYNFTISRYAQPILMRAALFRKLGYFIPSPKYYKSLKVKFPSEQEKKNYLRQLESDLSLDLDQKKWIKDVPGDTASVEFISAMLAPADADYFNFYFGYSLDPTEETAQAYIQLVSEYRAYRAQVLPMTLVDVPEGVNRFSTQFAMRLAGSVLINHAAAGAYASSTLDDARWILKRMAKLTEKDIEEIVEAGNYPAQLNPVIKAKLILRLYNALELFGLSQDFKLKKPDLKINSPDRSVIDGKVMWEFFPGYPQRFAQGDRPSPFSDEDIWRFLKIKGLNTALSTGITELNKKLQVLDVSKIVQKYQEEVVKDFIKHIRTKPGQPYVRGIDSFTGVTAGFNISSNRQITSGTYFGSTAPIQLVDNIGASASIGTFTGFTGMDFTPILATDLRYMIDYTHVRPLQIPIDTKAEGSLKEGSKYPWKNLLIPNFMNNIGELIAINTDQKNGLDEALKDLRDGEVLTVTSSVITGAYAQASAGLDALTGAKPLSIMNSIQLSTDLSRVVLNQVSFLRTANGVQIFVRETNRKMAGIQFDFNYFINLLRLRQQAIYDTTKTDAFIIDYSPSISSTLDPTSTAPESVKHFATRDKLQLALKDLFTKNKTAKLYYNFKYNKFDLDHKLKTKETRAQFLFNKMTNMTESHLMKATWPENPDFPDVNPKDSELILYSYKKGEFKGIDYLNFGFAIIDGLLSQTFKKVNINIADTNSNATQIPFGKAYWRMINTEGDLSTKVQQHPNITIVQNIWSGWKIKRDDLLNLINEINQKFSGLGARLIPPEDFHHTKSLDFYRISVSLSLLPGAQDKMRALLLQENRPMNKVEKAKFLSRVFQKISEARGKKRPQDRGLYNDLLSMIGDGDFKKGYQVYDSECTKQKMENEAFNYPTTTWFYGQNYSCLTPWMTELIDLSRAYPSDKKEQIRWMTEVVFVLEKFIPIKSLLSYIDDKNYLLVPNIFGFREGDEDGDLEYISNSLGVPEDEFTYANGLFSLFSRETGIVPTEVEKSNGSFR